MADPYAALASADPVVVRGIAERLELRAAHPDQQAMAETYLGDVPWPAGARVLDAGCGTGPMSRRIAKRPGIGEVVGLDPSPTLIERARELAAGMPRLRFEVGDACKLGFSDAAFDVVVFHTVLCHIPDPEPALAEARRVLRPGGWLAVFDGDYATATVAISANDPLQMCSAAAMAQNVTHRWIVRQLPTLIERTGFALGRFRSHGYAEVVDPGYLLGQVDRGADILAAEGTIGRELAAALKDEGRRRAADGRFFGHIAYASLVAQKA